MNPEAVEKVLVVKFFGIGSLVLATPFFREARKLFPNAEIHLLTLSSNRQITRMIPDLDRVHLVDLGANIFSAVAAFTACLFKTFKQRYDVLIDMEFYTRASAILSLASRARVRIGYHSLGVYRGDVQSHRIPFNSYWHVTRNFLSLLEPFGQQQAEQNPTLRLEFASSHTEPTHKVLAALGGDDSRFIVVNVNAGELAYERRWLPDRFARLAAWLSKHYDLSCVFIGSQNERSYAQTVVDAAHAEGGKVLNVAGELDLESLAQVCLKSLLVISNDSGPLHIAAAVGARVVGFYGPETPVLYGPVGDGHLSFHRSLSCSPCINIEQGKRFKCWHKTLLCQEGTTAEFAFQRIQERFGEVLSSS